VISQQFLTLPCGCEPDCNNDEQQAWLSTRNFGARIVVGPQRLATRLTAMTCGRTAQSTTQELRDNHCASGKCRQACDSAGQGKFAANRELAGEQCHQQPQKNVQKEQATHKSWTHWIW
jgi:hypothetical protein